MKEKYNLREYDFKPEEALKIHDGKTLKVINKEIVDFEKNFKKEN